MKKILTLIAILFCTAMYSQDYVLLEINSEWNWSNKAKIDKIHSITHKVAYLEQQTLSFKKKVKSVPLVILYKDGKPIKRWQADLSFKLIITKEQVLKAIETEKNN